MQEKLVDSHKICIVGLGYVGLPLAIEFSKIFPVIGFDISEKKIEELKKNIDSMNELTTEELKNANIFYTNNPSRIKEANFIIIAVPTPITKHKKPDLSYLESASELVGKNLTKGSIVVYESTVYPGVTEEVCAPILEKYSNLKCGIDFKIGYSPERVNPGDKEHTIDKITKVVSGMDEESLNTISDIYSQIIKAGLFKAKSIKVAEASKVIENIQRDLNIALMNELALIFHRVGIPTKDVLEAAGTKWNFHKYHPGLVGGHCIGVDPYYLTYKAQELGYEPQVILSGRNINNLMPKHVADMAIKALIKAGRKVNESNVLLMGLTFKEDVRDARNSRAKDLIDELRSYNANVVAIEPHLSDEETEKFFDIKNHRFEDLNSIDCVIIINKHKLFKVISLDNLKTIMNTKMPVLVDIKNMYKPEEAKAKGFIYLAL